MFFFKKKQRKRFDEPLVLDPADTAKMTPEAVVSKPTASDEPAPGSDEPVIRKRRRPQNTNKTRLMGFDTSDGRIVDLFGEDKATNETNRFQHPVAIVMVVKGPGFGECFAVKSGMSQIGRGEDQAIQLDFGDMAISRENHAAVVYDPKEHTFLLGHGGKSNIVRLNGKPVVSTSDLKNGDTIEIGETKLRFVALCSNEFNWESAEKEEGTDDDDVEIA
ncbi:MAG: FHA domain-containing protein [Pseudomonadota bacterium]